MSENVATVPGLPGTIEAPEKTFWTPLMVGVATFVGLLTVALGVLLGIYASWNSSGLIAPGMTVQGEPLGGLTPEEAQSRLDKRFGRLFVELKTPSRPYKVSLKQLGGSVLIEQTVKDAKWYGRSENIAVNAYQYWTARGNEQRRKLPVRWNKDQLRSAMWTVATSYNRPPKDARLDVSSAGIQIIPDEVGQAMNVGETCARLQKLYYAGLPSIEATTKETAPRLVAADLAGSDVQLGKYTTYFNSGLVGRTRNIYLAAEAINGKVLMPGEKFSFNGLTGERTAEKGYRIAHIFLRKPGAAKSEVVDGRGGGVCQVSTTLYNAVRVTNNKTDGRLDITERNNHSLPVPYVSWGMDATVAWPHKDFKFRNTFAHPVYVKTEVVGSHITIGIWGRVPDNVSDITVDPQKQASAEQTAPAAG